ncbi:hypothetical protein CONCODRAFT_69496 [Conidiobolus coronatus NRRL 28638]|uniref:Uncharacterized protein n=1 Tax=Conidiobolus coronatus (strain ATCC 28846 / CBS 209.66 / NRRL 28638) TaxID=796925 RepID=A0A137PA29_CONC2|nr:hypothetical protein CONCODRAFT_69496 [Conidiobolus coronatus NRRL 28638]|eukprot:KXN71857.1 hypothetical protein CONCODRAFT_69496 [Conidiobolus coronatus NRRL 28638]
MNYNKNNPPVKRTTFQQHKEEIEAKKRRDNEEIAQVLADFVADFGEEGENSNNEAKLPQVKTFLKSSTNPLSNIEKKNTQSQVYQPKIFNTKDSSILDSANSPEYEPNLIPQTNISKKRKNLDSFLEELKKEQHEREIRSKFHHNTTNVQSLNPSTSSRQPKLFTDTPQFDQNSTNLFVGNISTKVNETKLMEIFGKFGPIASVKIMWPRTPEESQRRNNSGFVCFMKRDDASEALSNLDGTDLMGLNLRIGWGKSVQLPSIPVYDPNHSRAQQPPTSLPFNITKPLEKKNHNQIIIPSDSRQLEVIHKTIERVLDLGNSFEQLIMERNSNDPNFAFLTDIDSPNHLYYKWKLHSLRQGDSMDEWRIQPFQLFENGPEFLPPPVPIPESCIDESSDLDSEGNELPGTSKGLLLPRKSKILDKMLNELTLDRDSIGNVMVFLVDNCDAADETCTAICDLLISEKIDNNHKLALLYVISDTLYNISLEVSGSWKLRTKFETLLPVIFIHFGSVHRGIQSLGRLKAEAFRKRVMTVIPGWERMTFFPQPYLDHLSNLFQYGEDYEQVLNPDQSTIKQTEAESTNASKAVTSEEIDGEPLIGSDTENVDGEEFKDDDEEIDGIAYNSDD